MKKRSRVWLQLTDEEFIELVKKSKTYQDIRRFFGFINTGNIRTIKQRIKELRINVSHFVKDDFSNWRVYGKIPLEEILVENSSYSRTHLKTRLLKRGLLKNECEICGQKGEWKGKKLRMVLDHLNGVSNDNGIENLRMVCPNCNSQLSTHCGKKNDTKKKIRIKPIYKCSVCGGVKGSKNGNLCYSCSKKKQRKVERPPIEQLFKDIEELGYCGTGRKYGVSDNAIRKWLK